MTRRRGGMIQDYRTKLNAQSQLQLKYILAKARRTQAAQATFRDFQNQFQVCNLKTCIANKVNVSGRSHRSSQSSMCQEARGKRKELICLSPGSDTFEPHSQTPHRTSSLFRSFSAVHPGFLAFDRSHRVYAQAQVRSAI